MKKESADMKVHHSPRTKCTICKCPLQLRTDEKPIQCTILGSESVEIILSYRKVCHTRDCRTTHRGNFAYHDGAKVNVVNFSELQNSGIYMVSSQFGFTVNYLKQSWCRFLRGNLAPGQEASVRKMLSEENLLHTKRLQSHLMRALEAFALLQRSPEAVLSFPIDRPSESMRLSQEPLLSPPPVVVKALCFDGHFGVHRALDKDLEAPRTVALRGRPPKKGKRYQKEERTCSCVDKERQRIFLKNRTAGWQFVIDPDSRLVVAAKEHIINESNADKAEVVRTAMQLPKVNPDLLIHDDACHFEQRVKSDSSLKKAFKQIKHYAIDEFHRCNHKCAKRNLTKTEKSRLRKVRTNMSEVFNAWIRRKNFALNSMNATSHRFWVEEAIKFWNNNLKEMPTYQTRRSTTECRKRPASKK